METDKYIELSKKQQRFFHASARRVVLADIDCDAAIIPLAMDRKDLRKRAEAVSTTDYTLYFQLRKLDKEVDLFVPIAHAVLLQVLDDLLSDPQKLNRDDL